MQRGERFLTFGRAQRATFSSSTCKFFQRKITFRNKMNPPHWLHFEVSRLLEETDKFIKKYRSFESCRSFMFSCCVNSSSDLTWQCDALYLIRLAGVSLQFTFGHRLGLAQVEKREPVAHRRFLSFSRRPFAATTQ